MRDWPAYARLCYIAVVALFAAWTGVRRTRSDLNWYDRAIRVVGGLMIAGFILYVLTHVWSR